MQRNLVLFSKPKSNISEDIRTIRTNLNFVTSINDSKVILITSSNPGEGKTFISSNIATAFAQMNEKTLLIDCDMRLGRVHEVFEIENKKGLSDLLICKNITSYKPYISDSGIDNLDIITRGMVPPNPSELLNSSNCKALINNLRDKYDRIIIDSLPVNGLPDALIMSNVADTTAIVCAVGKTRIEDLMETKKSLEKVGANFAGVIANKVEKKKKDKYSYYYE